MTIADPPDELAQLQATILSLYKFKEGELVGQMIHLGHKLGLYTAWAEIGSATSEALADKLDLHERWVREWLFSQSAAGLADHVDGSFTLTAAAVATLVDTNHPANMTGVFGPPIETSVIERTAEAFRTGIGLTWDDHGSTTCHFQAAMGDAGHRAFFIDLVIKSLEGVADRLQVGGTVIDVGCGAGRTSELLARAFPNASVLGIDPSRHAIEEARRRTAESSLSNLKFELGTFDDLPSDGSVDLLVTIDVIHDLPHPGRAMAAARSAIADDGTWVVADLKAGDGIEANRKIPVLPLMYSMSVIYCMSSALSEPGGAGLGTLGLHPALFEQMAAAAKFTRFSVHDHEFMPTDLHYELRP